MLLWPPAPPFARVLAQQAPAWIQLRAWVLAVARAGRFAPTLPAPRRGPWPKQKQKQKQNVSNAALADTRLPQFSPNEWINTVIVRRLQARMNSCSSWPADPGWPEPQVAAQPRRAR